MRQTGKFEQYLKICILQVMFLKSFFQRYIMKYSWMKWDDGLDLFQNNPGVGGGYREKKVGHECITHW